MRSEIQQGKERVKRVNWPGISGQSNTGEQPPIFCRAALSYCLKSRITRLGRVWHKQQVYFKAQRKSCSALHAVSADGIRCICEISHVLI